MASLTPAPVPRASLLEDRTPSSGAVVAVRAYTRIRNGQVERVRAHERRDPPGGDTRERVSAWLSGSRFPRRAEGSGFVIQAMARRPDPLDPRGKPPVLEGGPGGGGAARGGARPPPASSLSPAETARLRQEMRDILEPGGVPIGAAKKGARPEIRDLPGGDAAARRLFERLTAGRGGRDVTPPGHRGRLVELPDGSKIGYRATSSSGTPTVDINIPDLPGLRRIHFN